MKDDSLYAFMYRGMLTKTAVRLASRQMKSEADSIGAVATRLPFDLLEEQIVQRAKEMAVVFSAITAFENSVRAFVEKRLLEEIGDDWWTKCVPEKRRQKAESRRDEENKIRWHAKRGSSLLEYTDIEDLSAIFTTNQDVFLPIVQSIDWVKNIFKTVELSRNIIMHSGYLEAEDVERLGMSMRDWLAQIGA
ncbi:MAG TPA: Swt1 family HEPN domain-containing protein [Pirellulales bacterium]|nr:Swt1 family HEPN domain-containing protein [Pirellulales bacterium]